MVLARQRREEPNGAHQYVQGETIHSCTLLLMDYRPCDEDCDC
jgi:hypothetical protein